MKTFFEWLKESAGGIDKIAGVGDDDENFHVKFRVSDLIQLANQFPPKDVPMSQLAPLVTQWNMGGRIEDESETNKRVDAADLKYPVIVFANETGKIFAVGDGTHRVQKAYNQGLPTIQAHIIPKEIAAQRFGAANAPSSM